MKCFYKDKTCDPFCVAYSNQVNDISEDSRSDIVTVEIIKPYCKACNQAMPHAQRYVKTLDINDFKERI